MTRTCIVLAFALVFPSAAFAQLTVYPNQGQSNDQMQQDLAECQALASQQTGGASPPSAQPPGALRGAARGAILGGTAGALTERDASDTAAAGAAVGGLGSAMRRRDEQRSQQQQTPAPDRQALAACMQARGYSTQ